MSQPARHDVLRFITAGSVDDGKSTLIGRLLYDTKTIFEDQLEHVVDASRRRGDARVDLALLTDGLRAEREQGITIDVAYRYFSTPRRKFIIADAPGHAQYTRNMVTGASTADLAIVLVDARHGVVEQTRRHTIVASLLGIRHLVFAINKMDLVDFAEDAFTQVREELTTFLSRLETHDVTFIPMSALSGDNVVDRTTTMPWYQGSSLLQHLESVHIASDHNLIDVRVPVQWVIRPQSDDGADYRGYAGMVASGVLRTGDEAVLLPGGHHTRIERLELYGEPVDEVRPPMAATVHLADQLDVSRGNMLCRPGNQPTVGQDLDAMVVWFGEEPLRGGVRYALKHTTRWLRASVTELRYELGVETLHRDTSVTALQRNGIGRVRLRSTEPLFYDPYRRNRTTGSFILVEETTQETVGAGMLLPASHASTRDVATNGLFVVSTDAACGVDDVARGLTEALGSAGVDAVEMECRGESLEALTRAFEAKSRDAEFVVVSGSHGYRAPVDSSHTIAELPKRVGLGVVMVVRVQPGCASQAILTAEAIAHDGLPLAGWVARHTGEGHSNQLALLRRWVPAPQLGTFPPDPLPPDRAARQLDIAPLDLTPTKTRKTSR